MKLPLQISFRNLDSTPELEAIIRDEAENLDQFCDTIMSCRVVVDVPHRHRHKGNLYQIRLEVTVPGNDIAVTREAAEHAEATNLTAALRDAFDAAGRLLEDHVRRRRQDIKHHDPLPHARVRVVMPGQDHGFLESPDGREIYFHRNSLVNANFESLTSGTEVTFVEEAGEKGPQASTVHVVGRHSHV